ncbi:MAG TPA: hypothetical protein PLY09_10205 [Methanothrix sp.]|nr:hypothetical protein [Methanothrix sp.]HPJ85115.1 hypothetical protein [Methanothrix sp.]
MNDLVEAVGAGGAVLGLSGGLGSATVAFLAVRALGPDQAFAHQCRRRKGNPDRDREDVGD